MLTTGLVQGEQMIKRTISEMICLCSSQTVPTPSIAQPEMQVQHRAYAPQPNWALQGTLIRRIASATPYGRP